MAGVIAFLDHTADVGFEAAAPTCALLFHDSALAMLALLRGDEDGDGPADPAEGSEPEGRASRDIALDAPDPPRLLADWLRELLFLHEVDALDYESATFEVLELGAPDGVADAPAASRLRARVRLRAGGFAVREIKGVTYHEIEARPTSDGWAARVIFDV